MTEKISAILITGMPGVGKTTIVKKILNDLQLPLKIQGFYTEEIRNTTGERIGFDVVTLDGAREVLARTTCANDKTYRGKTAKVGKYFVQIDSFENIAIPILSSKSDILIIDEIGKMELLSKLFEQKIKDIIKNTATNQIKLIATIPCRQSLRVIDEIKSLKNSKLFEVTKQNRNNIYLVIKEYALNFS